METALEFMKLEKVELGGIKGKLLSQQVVQLHEEFQEQYGVFTNKTYDCLDPGSNVRVHHSHLLNEVSKNYNMIVVKNFFFFL